MLISRLSAVAASVAALAGLAAFGAGPAAAEAKTDYETLIDNVSPSLVTIKCVLKMQGPGGAQEREREFTALMIDNKGTVLCASVQLGTSKLMRRFGTITPTDIKVLIGDDTEGVEAKLLASDSELDLSWVQIKEPDAKGYAHVDFAKAATVKPGDRLFTVARMDKFFDRAPKVNEGRLSGETKKPRDLLVPSSSLDIEPGMPVFADGGLTVGVVVVQSPDEEDKAAGGRMATAALILPAAEVVKATQRAHETAAAEDEEEDEEGESDVAKKDADKDVGDKPKKDAGDESKKDAGDESKKDAGDESKKDAGDKSKKDVGDKPKKDAGDKPKKDAGDKPKKDVGEAAKKPAPKPAGEKKPAG